MEIHKPKPWHGFREFLKEYAIIVVGVLTALAGEQTVERAHWAAEVREGQTALRKEIAQQTVYYRLRESVEACISRQLDSAEAIVRSIDAGRREAPVLAVNRARGMLIPDGTWTALSSGAVLAHFEPDRLYAFGAIYAQARDIREWENEEGRYWDDLALLVGDPNRLSADGRLRVLSAINALRRQNYLLALNSRRQLQRAQALGVDLAPSPSEASRPECSPIKRGAVRQP